MRKLIKKLIKESKKQKHFVDSCIWIELYLKERKVDEVVNYIGELKRGKYIPHTNVIIIGEVIKTIILKSKNKANDILDFIELIDILNIKNIDITHTSISKIYNKIFVNARVSKNDSMDILNLTSAYNKELDSFITIENPNKPIWRDTRLGIG